METTKVKYRKWLEHKDDYYKYRKKFLEHRNKLVDQLKDSRHDACFGLSLGDQIFYRFFLAITVSGWLVPVSSFVWKPHVAHTAHPVFGLISFRTFEPFCSARKQ